MNANSESHEDLDDNLFVNVLADNNAQEVFKKLSEIDNFRDRLESRWVWELIQNARGTAGSQKELQIEVKLEPNQVLFRHNGTPFKGKEIAHLILHGSSKHSPEDIGKFGSGFITTHLLSRQVRVRGRLMDGRNFDFILSREGKNATDLRDAMEQSRKDFVASLDRKSPPVPEPFTTEYGYPLTESIREVVVRGIQALRNSASYIFAFNPMLKRLKISASDDSADLSQTTQDPILENTRCLALLSDGAELYQRLVVAKNGEVEAALGCDFIEGNPAINLALSVPRLFVAFPLNNTESFGVPLVLNSEKFFPREERDGIYLGTSVSEDNASNQALFVTGLKAIVDLIAQAAQKNWSKIASVTNIPAFDTPAWAKDAWLREQLRNILVEGFRSQPLLYTVSGQPIAPQSAWIPVAQANASAAELWHVTGKLNAAANFLPRQVDQEAWSQSLQSWLPFLKFTEPQPKEWWSVDKLAAHLDGLKSVNAVAAALSADIDALAWINEVHALIVKAGRFDLFRQRALIPNENGNFVSLGASLHLHDRIDETLKDIAEQLGFAVRATLIHTGITSPEIRKALSLYTEASLVSKTRELVGTRFPEHPLPEEVRKASIKFFGWLLIRGHTFHLDNYPVLSQVDAAEKKMFRLQLRANSEEKQKWLAPISLWPEPAKHFTDLFSDTVILHPDYADACGSMESWEKLESNGYLHLSPLYESESFVQDFLPDRLKGDDEVKSKIRSKEPHQRSEIAFFNVGEKSVLDRVRGSGLRGKQLMRFLLNYVLPADPRAFDDITVACDNGKEHLFYRGGWLTPLCDRSWISIGEGKSDSPSAESMARLLSGEADILGQIGDERTSKLLRAIGVSPADLMLRSVGHNDEERMSLIQSLAQISSAVGNNPERVKALAGVIEQDPEVLIFAEQRQQRRETVKRNQELGALVESLFEQAFAGTDLSWIRTGPGHDYLIKPDESKEQDVGRIEFKGRHGKVYVEIKATTTGMARMSVLQVEEAVAKKDHYFLCVVAVSSSVLGVEDFKANARFVIDIGDRFQNLWTEYTSMNQAVRKTKTEDSGLAIELTGQEVKFRVDDSVWQTGVTFDNVIAEFKSRLTQK